MAVELRQCQLCQSVIPAARLEALLQTRLCLQCSREMGGDSVLLVQLKDGSVKKTGSAFTGVNWSPPREGWNRRWQWLLGQEASAEPNHPSADRGRVGALRGIVSLPRPRRLSGPFGGGNRVRRV